MENKPSKTLVKSAAALSLTAILAAMPVSAVSGYANAGVWYADALAVGPLPEVYVELSCEYGSESDSDFSNSYAENARASADITSDDVDYHKGEIRAAYAAAWSRGEIIDEGYWPR